ncbi:hypothetical protein P153DRAFT_428181 [Dothidotthia symphoricarpi CBS 119687]|uniref:C2H2-type domain-containing protein n=1 Tax=Dothidotthia symphoricarpi CBS 119687 TaxID=1392245 RepID=A0A6A6AMI3_9PLEO|nr:uncharacterized protein P153DRAFT_428181 [Dothidotthia symphoricarpi CBS 119687]KAF2133139.1 hypothetical protein P153DRAFT_428181 [Dothidotthia symphoricarpi CBS 119687]
MPPRNNPLPAAVRLFNCTICDKGYPRQLDYENHLRSYDHNHRQRLADMKKLTASNETESGRPKPGVEMRSIDVEAGKGKMGKGFTKIGGPAAGGGGRFKKVGVAVGGAGEKKDVVVEKVEVKVVESEEKVLVPDVVSEKVVETKKEEDAVMVDEDEQEDITWEEYDFTKPTGCSHGDCPGLKTDGIRGREWIAV